MRLGAFLLHYWRDHQAVGTIWIYSVLSKRMDVCLVTFTYYCDICPILLLVLQCEED